MGAARAGAFRNFIISIKKLCLSKNYKASLTAGRENKGKKVESISGPHIITLCPSVLSFLRKSSRDLQLQSQNILIYMRVREFFG